MKVASTITIKEIKVASFHYLCGYVTVYDPGNLLNEDNVYNLDVHGGVTFYEYEDNMCTIGFDCNHAFDDIIKCNYQYVLDNCLMLKEQILKILNETHN